MKYMQIYSYIFVGSKNLFQKNEWITKIFFKKLKDSKKFFSAKKKDSKKMERIFQICYEELIYIFTNYF